MCNKASWQKVSEGVVADWLSMSGGGGSSVFRQESPPHSAHRREVEPHLGSRYGELSYGSNADVRRIKMQQRQQQSDWDSQAISQDHVQQPPQDDKRAVQIRTYTRWMNMFLQNRDPPMVVTDLIREIQDGRILMALLEELTGCRLLYRFRSSPHRIFRLNNISKALAFLDDRHVKLLGVDASGVADGLPSVVLTLVWNIILHFQVKEVTAGLQRRLSSSLSSLSTSVQSSDISPPPGDTGGYSSRTLPSKGRKAARKPKYQGKTLKSLLKWAQKCTSPFGVEVHDFGKSWRSGLAFLALIKSLNPALVDLRESLSREPTENMQQAFAVAQRSLEIPPLLEPEDVLRSSPDEQSIITYVSMFLGQHSDRELPAERKNVAHPSWPDDSGPEGEIPPEGPSVQIWSREQDLWRRWSRRSPGGALEPSHLSWRRAPQPPSPLDAGVASPDIRSWMEKGGQHPSKPRESHFSLSSEEGIYNLAVLDSDEEDAYSYILELGEDDFQPHVRRQVQRVEEETAEDVILDGELEGNSKEGVFVEKQNSRETPEPLLVSDGGGGRTACDRSLRRDHGSQLLEDRNAKDGGLNRGRSERHTNGTRSKMNRISGTALSNGDRTFHPSLLPPSVGAEGGRVLQSPPASCDITPLELALLGVLWLLLYCYLILPQMNL
ncbi:uncharacterized protein clmnb isoform X2 [Synchiropus splendidus]|uniref:uncharacterized protein clmnb isoform X2 n=1 Tax=Synchiropus splendidus TaxID=270530 RepID=UPI00237ED1B3|nr:uncharacterized protein clmnb isoform X2 [Synchiropus splendidus]